MLARRRKPGFAAALLLLPLFSMACDSRILEPPPSVVLITVDTLRPDRIAAYGHATNKTPAMDRLAAEGMLFDVAYCDMPWTTGSMSSVMTGHYSSSHGVDLPNKLLAPEATTMAEILRAEGYTTAAIIASFPLDSVFGLDQGFDTYDDEFSMPMIGSGEAVEHVPSQAPDTADEGFGLKKFQSDSYRPDEDVTDAAIRWFDRFFEEGMGPPGWRPLVDRVLGRRFFLWVHYFGPHEKLEAGLGIHDQEPRIVEVYDEDVEKADAAVGRFLDHLRSTGYLDETLVILHSDHGQNLGEHGVVGHGQRIDEATVRIPMIVRYPAAVPAGLRRSDVARNVDILPTVLEALRIDHPGLAGRSLLPSPADPSGRSVPAEVQTAYFSTRLTTLYPQPVPTPYHGVVLGRLERSGLRTPLWRYVEDQMVEDCVYGGTVGLDPMSAWVMKDGKPLDPDQCRAIRGMYLYKVSPEGDKEPNVAPQQRELLGPLGEMLRLHREDVDPLAASFQLTPEHEEKLRSLGYLK